MANSIQDRITKINKWAWIRTTLLLAFSAIIVLNSISIKLPLIGIPSSLMVLLISSVATSEIFFFNEKRFLKQMLGAATFVVMMALLGTFLMLVARFTETLSLVSFVAVGLILCLLAVFRKRTKFPDVGKQLENSGSKKRNSYSLIFPFLLSVAIAFYALLLARTSEGETSVWLTIPNFFLPIFFLSSLSLAIILFLAEMNVELKLALISVHSFLSHSLFLIVWYPGRYGDPWAHLGEARFIDNTGTFYAYDWLMSQHLISDIVKYKAQYALVILFRRMFSLDIYWVHIFLVPLLWSLFVPVFLYKTAELISAKKNRTFPLLTAMSGGLFSTFIYWGAISVPNSLGFLFLLFSAMLLLYWVGTHEKRFLLLSLLVSGATLFAHPQTGIFAFVFIFIAIIVHSKSHILLKIVFLVLFSALYPFVSYLQGASFSLEGFLNPENFLSFQLALTTLLLVFGFLGLVFSVRGQLVKSRSALLFFLFYIVVAADYYVSMYGMKNTLVPDRILPMLDLFLVSFVGLGLMVTTSFLKASFSRVLANPIKKVVSPRSLALLLICLFLSLQLASVLYQTYPRHEINDVQPAAYEIEAIHYIDSDAPGRYIVLCEPSFAILAAGFLGIDTTYGTGRGSFGVPEWGWWTMKLYSRMQLNPSISILEEAMFRQRVGVSYFVESVRDPAYQDVVKRTSKVLAVDKVFGDGKLTVFKYISTIVPIGGIGPGVKVAFDGGTFAEVQSAFNYFVKSAVTYSVTLSGHSSYNVTDYPAYWTFFDLEVNSEVTQFDKSSDVNTFIYIAGLSPNDQVEVFWQANEHYPHVGWKEDSFKYNWQTHPIYSGTISPNIIMDGNVLSLSWDFTTYQGNYQYYYYTKNVNVSSNDYPYILVRWKSTGPVAVVAVAYTDSLSEQYEVVPYSSESADWEVAIVKLSPDKQTAYVMVGITNLLSRNIDAIQTLYVDYILISAPE